MMNEIELLKEINKNCQTGIEGLEYTMDKVKDSAFSISFWLVSIFFFSFILRKINTSICDLVKLYSASPKFSWFSK